MVMQGFLIDGILWARLPYYVFNVRFFFSKTRFIYVQNVLLTLSYGPLLCV